eukprot:TRINITY_DN10132_c0_g2_i1.p1 TRINITY_DN10132_c0_g2~~TRINITY_DN10132_c0_g2_i1.p1  ORF type:complete len:358 (-),score=55.45 TRINITY_DN10132_c0_g2_i1:124-1197(-)
MVVAYLWKIALVFLIYIYVFWNLSSSTTSLKTSRLNAIGTVMGTGIICIILFYIRVPNYQPCRILFYSFMLWFGFILIAAICSCVFQLLEVLGLISAKVKVILILSATLLLLAYSLINAFVIRVVPITVHLKGRPLSSAIKLVHLTDLHLGSAYRRDFTERICNKIREVTPDLVVITGDLFDGNVRFEYELIEPFDYLDVPVYFVTGNHDMRYPKEIEEVVGRSKMIWLNNSAAVFGDLQLIGFDNEYPSPDIYSKITQLPLAENKVNLLLYHAPEFDVDLLSELNIALHLAGHTHGGQIFPVNLLMLLTSDYIEGLYGSEDRAAFVYVSPGLGTTKTQMRLGTKPTVAVLTLCGEK